jgi:HPt (histidine-containing phosphotransfer) domain-containing protein
MMKRDTHRVPPAGDYPTNRQEKNIDPGPSGNPEASRSSEQISVHDIVSHPHPEPEERKCAGSHNGKEAPLNFEEAMAEFKEDRDIFFRILDKFIQTVKNQIKTMQQALLAQDAARLRMEAHSIMGGAANLTAAPLAALAAELEEAAISGQLKAAPAILEQFQEEFQRLEAYIGEQLRKAP